MKFLAPVLTIFLAASSSVATPSGREGTKESRENTTRYHFPEDKTECVTHLVITDYQDKKRRDGESWYCEFSPDTAKNYGGIQTVAIKGLSGEELKALGALSGKTILRLDTSARITEEFRLGSALQTAALHIQDNSNVQIEMMDSETDTRHVDNRQSRVDKEGRKDTLVVRVIDRNNNAPPSDLGAVFSDELSLSNQIRDCSYNQMTVQPATQFSSNGIIDVRIDVPASDFTNFADPEPFGLYAKSVAKQQLGSSYAEADLVIYCLPTIPGLRWAAYAYVGGHESFYNDDYCNNHEVLLHEIGHNMDLGHSSQGNEEYGDFTGAMGAAYTGGKMCFNPAKSYQLGWYSKQVKSINPLDFPSVQTYFLNGVADYKSDGSNGSSLVVLRIENPRGNSNDNNDYYIGYNRKTGINSGTGEAADMVTITTQGVDPYGPNSLRIADLRAGDSFDEFSLDVEFTLSVVSIEGKYAKIEITSSAPNVQPTQPPVQPPTRTPSKAPTKSPTQPTSDCAKLQIELFTDDYGNESVWYLFDSETSADLTPGLGQHYDFYSNTVYWSPSRDGYHCLEKGKQYSFWMGDAASDGMCCTHGDGYYKLWLDGDLIHTGGQFLDWDEFVINVPDNGLPSPTPGPTPGPTPQPTPAPQPQNSCTDDLSFRFKNKSKKSCQWMGKRKKKAKKICKKKVEKGSSEKVYNRCRETCAAVGLGPCAN